MCVKVAHGADGTFSSAAHMVFNLQQQQTNSQPVSWGGLGWGGGINHGGLILWGQSKGAQCSHNVSVTEPSLVPWNQSYVQILETSFG